MGERFTMVTGASAGIGREIASVAAENGRNLAIVARREDRLLALARHVELERPCTHSLVAPLLARDGRGGSRKDSQSRVDRRVPAGPPHGRLLREQSLRAVALGSSRRRAPRYGSHGHGSLSGRDTNGVPVASPNGRLGIDADGYGRRPYRRRGRLSGDGGRTCRRRSRTPQPPSRACRTFGPAAPGPTYRSRAQPPPLIPRPRRISSAKRAASLAGSGISAPSASRA